MSDEKELDRYALELAKQIKAYADLKAENERLREALQDIASMKYGNNTMYAVMECMNYVARQALGEK